MGHLIDGRTRFERTPREWLKFGQQVGAQCNLWADRIDIVAYVGEGAGQGIAVAAFAPDIAEMELNVSQAFGETVTANLIPDFTERDTHFEFPAVAGATLHEAMHARHTKWPLSEMNELRGKLETFAVSHLIEWFEETRIEQRGVEHFPRNRAFLRACALKLSLTDLEAEDEDKFKNPDPMNLSKLILLSLARVDAGVLDESDVKRIQAVAEKAFGPDLLTELQALWLKAQNHRGDDDIAPLRKLAERWVELLEKAGHNTKPIVVKMDGSPAGEGGGEAEGDGDGMAGAVAEATEAMEDAAEDVEVDAAGEAADQAEEEHAEATREATAASDKESSEAEAAAGKIFGGASTGPSKATATKSALVRTRKPKDAEISAAVIISRELAKARYRDRSVTKVHQKLPPGRLNGRQAMVREVQRDQGRMVTAEPFTTKVRRSTEDPNLTLGMMTDISGSMGKAMEPMAVTNWVMSEAGRRIRARMGSVYYGNAVFPGLRPGDYLDEVKIYSAPDGTERFDLAFKALDGGLNLLKGSGARLLVIVSDMIYTEATEVPALKHWIRRCNQSGVAVLSLPASGRTHKIEQHTAGLDVRMIDGAMDPVAVATRIGQAAAEELTKAGTRART